MGSMGGSSFTPDTAASDATASLMRDQYSDYVTRYVPLEDELINMISEPINPTTAIDVEGDTSTEGGSMGDERSNFDGGTYRSGDREYRRTASMDDLPLEGMPFGGDIGSLGDDQAADYGGARKLGNTALTNKYIGDARGISERQMAGASDIMKRNAARRGLRFTGDKGDVFDRSKNLGTALMDVDVANKTRDSIDDFNVRMATDLMNTGRGLAGDASSMYMSASQLEANRNATNRGLAAQADASQMAGLGTAAGIAASFI